MSDSDLFVVCKNCSAEISPYVTECPYCGRRVRRRAPKLQREPQPQAKRPKLSGRSLPKLKAGEIPGIAIETRPYAVITLICISLALSVALSAPGVTALKLGAVMVPVSGQWWRFFATPFLYLGNVGYEFVALIATAIFGTAIERRFGHVVTILVFVLSGAAGAALAVATKMPDIFGGTPNLVLGANGAALGLLCAWLVDDRLAFRRGDDRENDLLGVYVIAAVLVCLSLAVPSANIAAAAGGAAAGSILGLILSRFSRA